ncbi:7-deoxyloganetic acid glucosyltransferase-like [Salvia hispanica]|uniref:7-deoxyloganetic acid glucosyltransferase-like n=1 Tax=Salvia hispanica TaxID=49212 RepID=UPI00200901CF|nr:7-deoxyloganetic acid glucosyltransferase-like [Salvia hispanica]
MSKPHILIFPAPAQGHITSMLNLAELLCATASFRVTFLVPAYIHRRLSQHSNAASRLSRLHPIPNDRPHEDIRPGSFDVKDWLDSFRSTALPSLRELLADDEDPIDCVISDGILSFVLEAAGEAGVPVFYMRTLSACAFWVYFCLPHLIQSQELPFDCDDLDLPMVNLRGMEGVLRRRDLPSCCRHGLDSRSMQTIMHQTVQTPRARGLILNTFDRLEAPTLDLIRTRIPNLYAVGPLHAHLRTRLTATSNSSSTTLWEEDKTCLKWLDEQPENSVVYVSFGSIVRVTAEARTEFWHGLVNSGKRFLWVVRPDSGGTEVAEGGRGRVVGWAPQEAVLAHPAVGGFVTHCGWNSTLESVAAGVPMVCWPHFGDQQVNSRFVDDVWGIGRDMKDRCDRVVVEKMVRDVMEDRSGEFRRRAGVLAKAARESVVEGGTSYYDLDRLIRDIRDLCNTA